MDYTLTINAQELQIISNAIGNRPFIEVNTLIAKLQKQVLEQEQPKPELKEVA